jgi:glycolate oxidase
MQHGRATDRQNLLAELTVQLGDSAVLSSPDELIVFEHDGSSMHGAVPTAVVFPTSVEQVSAIVSACHEHRVPYVARGAGTGLSGGGMALDGAVIIALNRMNSILSIDPAARRALVQPGVANLAVSVAAAEHGLYYAPDPSSQAVCSIGGNVAHNSGGPHTLKHGVTVNHVRGLQLVCAGGTIVEVGGPDRPGYDLLALLTGSEGTLGIVTRIELQLMPLPETVTTMLAAYTSVEQASASVSALIAAGIVPAALELLDAEVVEALSQAFGFTFPEGSGALLLIEADGPAAGMDAEVSAIEALTRSTGALSLRIARDAAERNSIWRARKQAFGALGRIARHYYTQDGVIPRTRLVEMLTHVREVGERHGLRIANIFHAGDGNLHPCILFDEDDDETKQRVLKAGAEILKKCVALGGSLTGEHGVGVEKREWMTLMFSPTDLSIMDRIRRAADPDRLCNPNKILPTGARCVELGVAQRQVAT